MAVTGVFQTYGDLTIKTDIVLDSVEIISAREDGIFAMLGKTNAIAMIHSYPVDTLEINGVYKSLLIDFKLHLQTWTKRAKEAICFYAERLNERTPVMAMR